MSRAKKRSERNPYDFYATPDYAIWPMLKCMSFVGVHSFLEPCRGDGAIYDKVKPLVKYAHYREIQEGKDYLTWKPRRRYDLIMTNPPFSLAEKFLTKSLEEADVVVYLLRLDFFGSQDRFSFWRDCPPMHYLCPLSKRPSYSGDGKTDSNNYGWFCWDAKSKIIRLKHWYKVLL